MKRALNMLFCLSLLDEHGHLKIYLPKKLLECLPKCTSLPKERHRWNTNEEIAAYLITFEKHEEWLTTSPKTRPQNGSMILYNRKKVKYRKDGYCWKKRKDGKTTREDHMKLKVQGVEVSALTRMRVQPQTSSPPLLSAALTFLFHTISHERRCPEAQKLSSRRVRFWSPLCVCVCVHVYTHTHTNTVT
uniref:CG-1 domain-containing protein n=1 Tax=Cyclopterus lumpus TaxID=8103 RepID=A0A8C2ZPA5_CYCLU